jgi:hypothetical protein
MGDDLFLFDEAHLDAFGLWYETGGPNRPLTPQEALETSAIGARDFRILLRWSKQLKYENAILEDDEV